MMTTTEESSSGRPGGGLQSRLSIRDGFEWDSQDAYLFDVDGTILRSRDRIHFNSFADSVREATGLEITLDGVVLHGGTDTAILREAFVLAGIKPSVWEPQTEAILDVMRKTISSRSGDLDMYLMPAVEETLKYLAGKGALLGLGTGNLEMVGWTKIERVGLREWFHFGGFSDRNEVRSAMVADAAAQARKLLSARPDTFLKICVVGDTPRDIQAARANDLAVIAVATGNYSFDELAALEPDVCIASLAVLMETVESQPAGRLNA